MLHFQKNSEQLQENRILNLFQQIVRCGQSRHQYPASKNNRRQLLLPNLPREAGDDDGNHEGFLSVCVSDTAGDLFDNPAMTITDMTLNANAMH